MLVNTLLRTVRGQIRGYSIYKIQIRRETNDETTSTQAAVGLHLYGAFITTENLHFPFTLWHLMHLVKEYSSERDISLHMVVLAVPLHSLFYSIVHVDLLHCCTVVMLLC